MKSFCLVIARFCPAAWVGAAHLFVIATVLQVGSKQFDTETIMDLTLIRFPVYYAMEFLLLGIAICAGFLARNHPTVRPRLFRASLILIALAVLGAIADYFLIYSPLAEMMRQQVKTANYRSLHEASKHINIINVYAVLVAAVLGAWPRAEKP